MPRKTLSARVVTTALRRVLGGPADLDEPRPLEQILLLFLTFDSDMSKARASLRRLQSEYVDWNEVRVTSSYELRKLLRGHGVQKSQEKAEQMKQLLSAVYSRFNKVNLDFLNQDGTGPEDLRRRERFQVFLLDMAKGMVSEKRARARAAARKKAARKKTGARSSRKKTGRSTTRKKTTRRKTTRKKGTAKKATARGKAPARKTRRRK